MRSKAHVWNDHAVDHYVIRRLGHESYYYEAAILEIFKRRIKNQLPWLASKTEMHNLFKQPRTPLMFATFARLDFLEDFGHFSPIMHLTGASLNPLINSKPSSTKNLDDFFLIFIASERFDSTKRCWRNSRYRCLQSLASWINRDSSISMDSWHSEQHLWTLVASLAKSGQ